MIKHFGQRTSSERQESLMSENYSTTRGLGWAVLIIVFCMVGLPILGSAIAYPDQCKQSILIPCLGLER